MSDAQLRVLGILAGTALLEAITSQNVRTLLSHPSQAGSADLGAAVAFIVSGALLLLLADAAPGVATGLAILILLLALFHQSGALSGVLSGATSVVQSVSGGKQA